MKTILSLCLLIISFASQCQHEIQKEYLVVYGQIWGFLKYFHPSPSEQDWDKVLLNDFDGINKCVNDSSFNVLISTMIDNCGSFEPNKRVVADSLKFQESFEWIENNTISPENKMILIDLLNNKPKFKNKYIAETFIGNPKIINELDYDSYRENPSIQFLALSRYWNIINYFCPNRNIIPKNWTDVYKDYVKEFISISTYEDYYFAVLHLTTEIRDGHGFLRTDNNPTKKYMFAPFYCKKVSDGFYITYVSQDSLDPLNIKKMDKIISINGSPVEEKIKQVGTIYSSSNDYYLSKATYFLSLIDADTIAITIKRTGQLIHEKLPTISIETFFQESESSISDNKPSPYGFFTDSISEKQYCYIDMGKLERSHINRKFKRKLLKTDHIIIDSRNYPNWTLLKLTKVLVNGRKPFAKSKKIDFDYPGSYEWGNSQKIGQRIKKYTGNIYVLVDYNTMSQAEYTVMAFQQNPNTIVIGGQTAGADGNITEVPLPFGIESVFSGLSIFYPDGEPTQQVGVRINYPVVQDSFYLSEQKDLILEKALELIRE